MLRAWVGSIAIVGLVIACEKAEAPSGLVVDDAVWLRVIPKIEAAAQRPAFDAALDTLASGLGEDPKLVLAGTTLLGELSAEPKIGGPLEALIGQLGESPEIQAEVLRLMAQHPGATPDQVGELVGQHFEEVWASRPVSEAWMTAFNLYLGRMRGRPEAKAVLALVDGLQAPQIDAARVAKWGKRLAVLEGKRLEGGAAQEAYLRHAWSDARIDAFVAALARNPAVHRITAAALVELLALRSFRGDVQTAAVALLSDAEIRRQVLAIMLLLAQQDPPISKLRLALTELMTTPALIESTGALVRAVLANPDVRKTVQRWYAQVGAEPSIRGELDKFLDGW